MPATPFGVPLSQNPGAPLPPLTRERVSQALTRLGVNHGLDEDGDPVSLWEDYIVRFICTGERLEVFQIRGLWGPTPPADRRGDLLEFCNEWHDTHRWPTAFLHREGELTFVFGDITTDLEHGVTDLQLEQLIRCGVGTCASLFTDLKAAFPEHTAWVPQPTEVDAAEQSSEKEQQ